MAIGSGIDTQLGMVAGGATYGTPETVTRFLEFLNESMADGHVGKVYQRGLGRSRFQRQDRVRTYQRGVSGSVDFEVLDTGFGLLLKNLLGAVSTAAGPPVVHTITPDAAALYGLWFDLQIGKPAPGGTVHPFTYAGCKVTSWAMKCAVGEALMLTTNLHARSLSTGVALASKSYATDARPFIFVDGAITVGGSAIPVKSVMINGNNGLDVERIFLGSGLTSEPIAAAIADITGELEAEFTALTELTAWAAGTQAALVLTFNSARTLGASTYQLTVTIPLIEYTGEVPVIGGPQIVPQKLPFKALYDGSNAMITMAYRTSDASP